ncbi:MAG: hypothetical protein CL949_13985 [Erythrobacter sp.]|mgnify:FL=1|nr:hypothetical protein [Erythrobacter sp.]
MFKKASDACDMLARNFQLAGYEPGESTWRDIRKGVKRDLQARGLRPNVPVPSRRHIFAYFRTMWRETGSVTQTVQSYLHDGSWTSSGGSFLLAERLGYDLPAMIAESLDRGEEFRLLEVGGGWAGFKNPPGDARDIAGLSRRFSADCGSRLHLHFTNLTPWHSELPQGVTEHSYLTGASLGNIQSQGCLPRTVDVIYSQAAVYFETDIAAFLANAWSLLKNDGLLIFNYPEAAANSMRSEAAKLGLQLCDSLELGGMNGSVTAFRKQRLQAVDSQDPCGHDRRRIPPNPQDVEAESAAPHVATPMTHGVRKAS